MLFLSPQLFGDPRISSIQQISYTFLLYHSFFSIFSSISVCFWWFKGDYLEQMVILGTYLSMMCFTSALNISQWWSATIIWASLRNVSFTWTSSFLMPSPSAYLYINTVICGFLFIFRLPLYMPTTASWSPMTGVLSTFPMRLGEVVNI